MKKDNTDRDNKRERKQRPKPKPQEGQNEDDEDDGFQVVGKRNKPKKEKVCWKRPGGLAAHRLVPQQHSPALNRRHACIHGTPDTP